MSVGVPEPSKLGRSLLLPRLCCTQRRCSSPGPRVPLAAHSSRRCSPPILPMKSVSSVVMSSSSPSFVSGWVMTRELRYVIGDVRDLPRLSRAMRGVDVVVHAAALKQVPACEYNPFEAVQTNIIGAENVVCAAIENDVPLTVSLSSGKAVNPVNVYGATKLCAEKIFTQGTPTPGFERPVRKRPLWQRRRQPRQRDPAVQSTSADGHHHDHRRAHDAILDHDSGRPSSS